MIKNKEIDKNIIKDKYININTINKNLCLLFGSRFKIIIIKL